MSTPQTDREFPAATVGGEGPDTPDEERYDRREDEKARRLAQEQRGCVEAQPDVETR